VLYDQNYCKKKIAKKEIWVSGCERPSWWNNSFELILVVLVRRIRFLLVTISFHVVVFIFDGTFHFSLKIKYVADGIIEKHKARFVAREFSQIEGIDYDETFALVVRYTPLGSIMAIGAEMGWKIHKMDVKIAFFNGFIEDTLSNHKGSRCWGENPMCAS
jgi:hypothetical protein